MPARAIVRWRPLVVFLSALAPVAVLGFRDHLAVAPSTEVATASEDGFTNFDVLHRLFHDRDVFDEEEHDRPVQYDAEDDAFLGVVAKVLEVIEAEEGGDIGRAAMLEAARHREYPHFEAFVGKLFDEADANGDALLDDEESEALIRTLRLHIAREIFGQEDADDGVVFLRILSVLDAHPDGGLDKDSLVEAAEMRFYPEMSELVAGLFEDADQDADGALNRQEMDKFQSLLVEVLHLFVDDHDALAEGTLEAVADEGDSRYAFPFEPRHFQVAASAALQIRGD